jgi:phosphorylase kinase alpha/beta subunit
LLCLHYTDLSATTATTNSQTSTVDKNDKTNKPSINVINNNENNNQNEGMLEEGRVVTVRSLLKGLYEKACQQKLWGLVRHTAGMLGKRVEDLAKAVTDLLVRQKQVS